MLKTLSLLPFIGLALLNCNLTEQAESGVDETSNDVILNALKERNDIGFNKSTRDLNTLIEDSSDFNHIFPNTDVTCGYVVRYFFHTNIHLGKDFNELVSMNGTVFNLDDLDYPKQRKEYIIYLSKRVINTIGDMYYGAAELQHFLDAYPDVDISY